MKIVVTGTRGIPDIQGGVETVCQELYPRIAAMGHDVTVIRRTPYVDDHNRITEYRGVKLIDLYAPRKKSLEAIVHTFMAVIKARALSPDIVHIHAIGPGLIVPFARMLGLKVVTTNHGPDYDRQKWGGVASYMLRLGERLASGWSNRVIVISRVIADIVAEKYGRKDTDLIYNGVNPPVHDEAKDYIESLGLVGGRYVVGLARLVKEKGFHDLIEAWSRLRPEGWKLVIAGDADHPDDYSRALKERASQEGVVMTGFIRGRRLHQLMTHAGLYCMPSYHEGMPIALLEAMSYGLDAIVSDIPANKLPCLEASDFFKVGEVDSLVAKLKEKIANPLTPRSYDLTPYDWDNIARQTVEVYNKALGR